MKKRPQLTHMVRSPVLTGFWIALLVKLLKGISIFDARQIRKIFPPAANQALVQQSVLALSVSPPFTVQTAISHPYGRLTHRNVANEWPAPLNGIFGGPSVDRSDQHRVQRPGHSTTACSYGQPPPGLRRLRRPQRARLPADHHRRGGDGRLDHPHPHSRQEPLVAA